MEESDRSREASARVEEAIRQSHGFLGRAASGDFAAWAEAGGAAESAVKLAEHALVDPRLKETASRTLAEVEDRRRAAVEEAARAAAERELEARLDTLRFDAILGDDVLPEEAFAAVFLEGGLDPDGPGRGTAVARIRGSRLAGAFADGLSEWAAARRARRLPDGALRSIARDLEVDAWTAELRDAVSPEDLERIARASGESADPARAIRLARAFALAGVPDRAIAILKPVREANPADVWVQAALGDLLARADSGETWVSRRYLTAAVALRPREIALRDRLGRSLLAAGLAPQAEAYLAAAVAEAPGDARPRVSLALLRLFRGDPQGAVEEARAAVSLAPGSAAAAVMLGRALLESGSFAEAATVLGRAGRPGEPLLENAKAMIEVEARLPGLIAAGGKAPDAGDLLAAATCCARLGRHAAATRLYARAFELDERLAVTGRPSGMGAAARSAALAGCAASPDSQDLTQAQRADHRKRAREWLLADFGIRRSELGGNDRVAEIRAVIEIRRWREDRALAGIRDARDMETLPAEERETFLKFWEDVDAAVEDVN